MLFLQTEIWLTHSWWQFFYIPLLVHFLHFPALQSLLIEWIDKRGTSTVWPKTHWSHCKEIKSQQAQNWPQKRSAFIVCHFATKTNQDQRIFGSSQEGSKDQLISSFFLTEATEPANSWGQDKANKHEQLKSKVWVRSWKTCSMTFLIQPIFSRSSSWWSTLWTQL